MSSILFLIPVSIALGLMGLCAFIWSLCHDQFEDMKGDAARILTAPDRPVGFAPDDETGG